MRVVNNTTLIGDAPFLSYRRDAYTYIYIRDAIYINARLFKILTSNYAERARTKENYLQIFCDDWTRETTAKRRRRRRWPSAEKYISSDLIFSSYTPKIVRTFQNNYGRRGAGDAGTYERAIKKVSQDELAKGQGGRLTYNPCCRWAARETGSNNGFLPRSTTSLYFTRREF